MQKMFGFANRKRTKRNTGEETLDWNRDCLSYDSSAAKLPYSYYPQGKRAVEPFVRILTEPLGLSQKIYHHPTGRQFFNEVEGFVINDKLTVLRYYGYGVYPGICKQLAVIFGGRLPTGDEMREIARNVDRICVSLAAVGEGPLYRGSRTVWSADHGY